MAPSPKKPVSLSPEEERLLRSIARALKLLRNKVDPEMPLTRIELLLAVMLSPEKSVIEHGEDLGLVFDQVYRATKDWTPLNAKKRPGYARMEHVDAPPASDQRAMRRLHVGLNPAGRALVKELLAELKA